MNQRWFVFTVVVTIAFGIFFRVYHLDRKIVWSDEVFSQIRILGLTESDLVVRSERFSDVRGVRAYLSEAKILGERRETTTASLVAEDPQHPPLYFLLARWWFSAFGDSIAMERLLSAIFGILALPSAFFLARELSPSTRFAWTFVAFVAVSPYFVLYSQEIREYALWGVAVLLSSAFALRAVRTMKPSAWGAYAVSIALALYTDPLSLAVIGAHVAYFATIGRQAIYRAPAIAVLAVSSGVMAFAPWLLVIVAGRAQIEHDMSWIVDEKRSPLATLRSFLGEWHLAVIDFNAVVPSKVLLALSIVAFVAIVLAFVVTWRLAENSMRAFATCLAAAAVAPILLPDLLGGGNRSANPRYLLPFFIAVELALAYAVTLGMRRDRKWAVAFGAVIVAGFLSCTASARAFTWWTKYNEQSIALARTINASAHPIVVSDNYVHLLLSFVPYLKPETRIALRPTCYLCRLPIEPQSAERLAASIGAGDDVFVLGPTPELLRLIRARAAVSGARVRCIDVKNNCSSSLRLF